MAVFGEGYYSAMDDKYQGMGLSPKDIGISTPPMKDQLESLKARIFQGASRVELGFMGRGKGSMQGGNPTPGSYGADEREAIRDLAKLNTVQLSTHTSPAVGNLSGLTERGFSEGEREKSLHEIQRTIDFAADTARGGPVVVHTGEWSRPMYDKFPEFKEFKEEEERAVFHLADKRTGEIQAIRKDMILHEPIVTKRDPQTGEPMDYKRDEEGNVIIEEKTFDDIVAEEKKHHPELSDEEAFIRHYYDAEKKRMHAESLYWGSAAIKARKDLEKKEPYLRYLENQYEKTTDEFGKQRLKLEIDRAKMEIDELKRMSRYEEAAIGYEEKAKELERKEKNMKPIIDVGLSKSADTIARAGEYAMEMTKKKHLPNPLFVAPENIFPESYGAHPQELKKLILEARDKMAEDLAVAYGKEEAERLAKDHIKATFDVGHAYTWRKFFEKKPGETMEQADKRFNKWLAGQVKELTDEGIIGHVHVSDNFGWADEHVTPGEGRVPIKDFIEQIKKAGIKNVIVEPAHQDYKAMLGGWKEFGSSIYSVSVPGVTRDSWTDIQHSYFGKTGVPNYIVGEFAPSKDWTLWSQTPLE